MTPTDNTHAALRITDADIDARKHLLGFTPAHAAALGGFRPLIEAEADAIIAAFYRHQLAIPEIAALIGDPDTLARVSATMRRYVLGLFGGAYGVDYVNTRLRIGKVHARIGVSPRLYIAALHHLETILRAQATAHGAAPDLLDALHKLFLFDLQLVFDTYIEGLLSQVENAHHQLLSYSQRLESEVADRTTEIARVARVDPLTGLDNRREFFRALAAGAADAFAANTPLALAFFDVDDFKQINDTRGHLHGDRVLAWIGAAMQSAFARSGGVFRYGGDEFCVLMPGADSVAARAACAAFCAELDDGLSVSYGVAQLEASDRGDLDQVIARADAAMYAGKQDPARARREA